MLRWLEVQLQLLRRAFPAEVQHPGYAQGCVLPLRLKADGGSDVKHPPADLQAPTRHQRALWMIKHYYEMGGMMSKVSVAVQAKGFLA